MRSLLTSPDEFGCLPLQGSQSICTYGPLDYRFQLVDLPMMTGVLSLIFRQLTPFVSVLCENTYKAINTIDITRYYEVVYMVLIIVALYICLIVTTWVCGCEIFLV